MLGRRLGAAAVLTACAVGCGSSAGWSSSYQRDDAYDDWGWRASSSSYRYAAAEGRDAPPDHGLSDAEVAAALSAQTADATLPPASQPTVEQPVTEAAAAVAACYRRGDREAARALVAAHPGLVDWDDAGVVVSCRYVGGMEGVELMVVRTDTSLGAPRDALAVCFEPGTYGVAVEGVGAEPGDPVDRGPRERWTSPDSERRYGTWPAPQDLALLRAPVVVVPRGEAMGVAYVPVACASFHRGAPDAGTPYALARFPAGSTVDRLMTVLCQGDDPPGDAEAQLAVWLARDDVSWADFVAQGGDRGRLVTFGQARSVRAGHASGAARLLLRAGVDPRPLRFFDPTGGEQVLEPSQAAPDPAPTPPLPPVEPPTAAEPGSQLS